MSPRWIAPDATDPDVILSFIIPAPVTRNPDHISLLGLVLRGFLVDRLGRCLGNNHPGLGILVHLLCKSLMKRTTGQDLDALLSLRFIRSCPFFLLATQCGHPQHQYHKGNQDHCITGKKGAFHFLSSL
jgi:hypothetical protein